jgi:hypothetical protein
MRQSRHVATRLWPGYPLGAQLGAVPVGQGPPWLIGLEIVVVLPGNEQVTDLGARVFAERCRSRSRGRAPGGTGVPAAQIRLGQAEAKRTIKDADCRPLGNRPT